jgi:hypothetical protein
MDAKSAEERLYELEKYGQVRGGLTINDIPGTTAAMASLDPKQMEDAGVLCGNPNAKLKFESMIFPKDVFKDEERFAARYMPERKALPDFSLLKSH